MKINLIAACDVNQVIGVNGRIPWHIPEDLKRFKQLTMGHAVIMGRRTWESLGRKELPGRLNIVVSSKLHDVYTFNCLNNALVHADYLSQCSQAFIIGGEELYKEALPLADRVYLTTVYQSTEIGEGDTVAKFPKRDMTWADWDSETVIYRDTYRMETWRRSK